MSEERKLQFRGGIGMSLIPVAIYVFFCMVLFIGFKAFNMEALAVGGFLALLIGGVFCTSYSDFWESAIKGISSITSVSVVVILLLVGMFSALIKLCGLSGGCVWIANAVGMKGGIFVAFTFIASCIVSTATGSSIGTMFIAFPIFYPAGIMLGANEMMMAGCIVSGAIFGDNLAPISDTTIASASTQQFKNGKPADIGGVVSSRIKYSAVAGLITIVIFAVFGGMGGVRCHQPPAEHRSEHDRNERKHFPDPIMAGSSVTGLCRVYRHGGRFLPGAQGHEAEPAGGHPERIKD